LVQIVSTIQSSRTAETVVNRKGAVSAGIPVAYFQRSRSLPTLNVSPGFFGLQSPHPKIPFPATEFRDGTDQPALGKSRRKASFVQLPELVRIQSEGFELSGPFRGRVAESLDTNAARQTTFDCCFDEVRCEERQRDSHIDLSHAAFLACGDLLTGVRAFEQALSSFRSALVHSRRLPFFLVTLAFFKFIVP
jgi:hypothetical protein